MGVFDKLSLLSTPFSGKRQRVLAVSGIIFALLAGLIIIRLMKHSPGKWELAWSDEFSGTSLDTTKWTTRDEAGKYNHELQYYVPNNVSVQNSTLRIICRRQKLKGRYYTSGAVETKGKFFFLYGRVEICARVPHGKGVWPAFWLLPEDQTWPPEIDVMELMGQEPTVIHMTNYRGTAQDHPLNSGTYTGGDFSQDWHTYAMEWEPTMIRWYVDGIQRFASSEGVPDKPMYLILNTAVGGDFPGIPDVATPFPQEYEIHYVRVWQRQ